MFRYKMQIHSSDYKYNVINDISFINSERLMEKSITISHLSLLCVGWMSNLTSGSLALATGPSSLLALPSM